MKKTVMVFIFFMSFGAAEAQQLVWNTNLDKAIEISQKTKKPIMLFFTGSDWCGWCIRLQKEVFKTPQFATWVMQNVVPVEIDFPRSTPLTPELKKQNTQLQQFFEIQGYPTVWFVNADASNGKISFTKLGSTGYVAGGPSAWLNAANQILKN